MGEKIGGWYCSDTFDARSSLILKKYLVWLVDQVGAELLNHFSATSNALSVYTPINKFSIVYFIDLAKDFCLEL
jgi:hypothetical protein